MEKSSRLRQRYYKKTHSSSYVDDVENAFPKEGLVFLDGDTVVSPGSKDATFDAVGSIITAIDGVENKEYDAAHCVTRPPGHHAEKSKAMGFCVINNISVAANYLISKYKYKRVAVIDWDCHFGNGSYDILKSNENVFFLAYINILITLEVELRMKKVNIIML